jgi:hypothetical protein
VVVVLGVGDDLLVGELPNHFDDRFLLVGHFAVRGGIYGHGSCLSKVLGSYNDIGRGSVRTTAYRSGVLQAYLAAVTGLMKKLRKAPPTLLKLPYVFAFLLSSEIGSEYGLGFLAKLKLVAAFRRNNRQVETLSTIVEHLELASALLRVPRSMPGIVVECGCYKGGSTVNISLVCALVGRELMVCDSFQGLPAISDEDRAHISPIHAAKGNDAAYEEGEFAISLDTVRSNLERFGRLDVCRFNVGYFEESMASLDEPVAMAFLDVDLISSLNPCLEAIWPRLGREGRVYVHEADDLALVARFFDRDWWKTAIGVEAPGFVGGGSGLPLAGVIGSSLGYSEKESAAGVPVNV